MPIKPTGSLEVQVDIDLTSGKIESAKLLSAFQKKLESVNKEILKKSSSTGAIPLDIKLDSKGVEAELARITKQINDSVAKALQGLGVTKTTKNNFADQILKQLKDGADLVDKQGNISVSKIKKLFRELADATNNPTSLGPKGQNPLKEFLSITGKSLDEATAELRIKSNKYNEIIANLKASQKEALASVAASRSQAREINAVLNKGQKTTVNEINAVTRPLSNATSKVQTTKTAFEQNIAPGSTAPLDAQTASLQKYINAVRDYRTQLEIASKSGTDFGLSQKEMKQGLSEADALIKKLDADLHTLSGAINKSTTDLSAEAKASAQAAAEIQKLEVALVAAQKVLQSKPRGQGDEATIKSLREILALTEKLEKSVLTAGKQPVITTAQADITKLISERDLKQQKFLDALEKYKVAPNTALKDEIHALASDLNKLNAQIASLEHAAPPTHPLSNLISDAKTALAEEEKLLAVKKQVQGFESRATGITNSTSFAKDAERLQATKTLISDIVKALQGAQFDTSSEERLVKLLEKARADALALESTIKKTSISSAEDDIAKSKQKISDTQQTIQNLGASPDHRERLQLLAAQRREEERLLEQLQRLARAQQAENESAIARGRAAPQAANLAETNRSIDATRQSIRSLNQELSGVDNLFTQAAQAFKLFLRYAVGYQILYSIASGFSKLTSDVLNLQTALVNIKAVTGATSDQIKNIGTAIEDVAGSTSFSLDEIAKAGQILVQAGIPIEKFAATLKATAELAAATGSSIQEASDVITTFSNVFDNIDSQHLADILTNAVNLSKLTVADLSTINNYVLAEGNAIGLSAENLVAAEATLRNAGLKASTIGTGLREGILEVFNPDKKTLDALQKRYSSIGIELSTDTIKGMFQGFQKARDPILAVINELEKLGAGGIGENDLTRVFSVRAENVIKQLVQNKNELISNSISIQKVGTAAAGAKTQLESLQHSFQNLGEAISSGFFDIVSGGIDSLAGIVGKVTAIVTEFRNLTTNLKAATGTTGAGASTLSAIAITTAAVLARFSLGWAAIVGVITGVSQQLARVYGQANQSLKLFSDAVRDVAIGLALYTVGSAVFSKTGAAATAIQGAIGARVAAGRAGAAGTVAAAAPLTTAQQFAGLGAASAANTTVAGLTAGTAVNLGLVGRTLGFIRGFFGLAGWGLLITLLPLLIDGAGKFFSKFKIVDEYSKKFFDLFGVGADDLQAIAEARTKQAEDAKKGLDKTREAAKQSDISKQQLIAFKDTLASMEEGYSKLTSKGNADQIREILFKASNGVVSVGSAQLEQVAQQIATATKTTLGSVNRYDLSATLQKINTVTQEAEALRKQYIEKVDKALSDLGANPEDTEALEVVRAYRQLSDKTKTILRSQITDANSVSEVLSAFKESSPIDLKAVEASGKKAQDATIASVLASYQLINDLIASSKDRIKARSSIESQINEAINKGEVSLVERIVANTGSLFGQVEIAAAKKNQQAIFAKPFEQSKKEVQNSLPASDKGLPSVGEFEAQAAQKKAQVEKDNLKNEVDSTKLEALIIQKKQEIALLDDNVIGQIKSGLASEESISKAKDLLLAKQNDVKNLEDKLHSLKGDEITTEDKLKAIKQSFLAGELQIANLQNQLKQVHNAKLHDAKKESDILREIYDIEQKQLATEKEVLAKSLAKLIQKDRLFETKGLNPDQLIKGLSGKAGADALSKSEELANAYKALVEVVDKEKNLRDKLVTDLDNVSRKELETKQKTLKAQLTTQIDRTNSSEGQLQTVTKRLTAARNKLISSYEKLAELEQFFALALRDVKGLKTTKSDIEDLISQARAAGDTNLAKQAATEAQAGVSAGTIHKSDAVSLIEDARTAALDIQNNVIARNTQQVQYLEQVQTNLADAVNNNIQSQYNLQQSLDALNSQIAKLAGDIGASVPSEAAPPKAAPITPADTSVEDVPVEGFATGGLVTGPGSTTSDSIPIMSSTGEFIQPASAVQYYGPDFMAALQNLKIDPALLKAIAMPEFASIAQTSKSDISNLQPVLFNIGGDTIHTTAAPDAVAQFQAALRIQALKSGRRIS